MTLWRRFGASLCRLQIRFRPVRPEPGVPNTGVRDMSVLEFKSTLPRPMRSWRLRHSLRQGRALCVRSCRTKKSGT